MHFHYDGLAAIIGLYTRLEVYSYDTSSKSLKTHHFIFKLSSDVRF